MFVVSLCLVGINCTYRGGNNRFQPAVDLLMAGRAIPVCPEQLGGLPTPRIPAEIYAGRVVDQTGRDVSTAFYKGVEEAWRLVCLAGCRRALLKFGSPSCGCGGVYDGSFSHRLIPGDGIFAAVLKKNGIPVETERSWNSLAD